MAPATLRDRFTGAVFRDTWSCSQRPVIGLDLATARRIGDRGQLTGEVDVAVDLQRSLSFSIALTREELLAGKDLIEELPPCSRCMRENRRSGAMAGASVNSRASSPVSSGSKPRVLSSLPKGPTSICEVAASETSLRSTRTSNGVPATDVGCPCTGAAGLPVNRHHEQAKR